MRRAHSLILAVAVCLPLAGCYYDPGYGYVRNGSGGDAYYGEETTTVVSPGYSYYDYGPGCCFGGTSFGTVWYDDDYGRRYYGRDYHGHPPPRGNWHGRPGDNRPGNWQGNNNNRPPGGAQGNNNRPPGGWHGGGRPGGNDGDHGPPRGNWQGGNRPSRGDGQGDNRPQGGWRGGDRGDGQSNNSRPQGGWQGGGRGAIDRSGGGDHRPQSSAAPRAAPAARQNGSGRDRSRFRSDTD